MSFPEGQRTTTALGDEGMHSYIEEPEEINKRELVEYYGYNRLLSQRLPKVVAR